ncbi:DUF1415 domain-containing protein [Methylobacter sp.]|uniref:DUF1415 domain-containing protein n=1 Tax=Methylobacter sp. TaxID=2051955 RepID=UPI003DA680FF
MSMQQLTDQQIISATQAWVDSFIIGYNICPFAKRERERGSIYFTVNRTADIEYFLEHLIQECERLDSDDGIETILLIYPEAFTVFADYLDYLDIAERLLIEQGYEGIYQLASFHPGYCFEGAASDDPANYTNRSPYPMLHLIREESIERAVAAYPHPENIPERNIELTRRLGLAKMQALLSACYQTDQ